MSVGREGRRGRAQAPHVAIAEFSYRHEAEFAAGFLRDAGIPFRLQIDDAGGADAGVTIARPAVLWVRAEDEEEARDLLDTSEVAADGFFEDEDGPPEAVPVGRPRWNPERLCGAERVVAGLLALALFGLAASGGPGAVPWVGLWEGLALALALVLGLAAVSGQTFATVRAILRMLSGRVP